MNKVKIMLSAIIIVAILGGTLAFNVRSNRVCAYSTAFFAVPPLATTTCPLVAENVFMLTTTTTASTRYASTLPTGLGRCTIMETVCQVFRALKAE